VVSWFVSVGKLFEQLSVPAELQSILIRPYFSERAKLLMSRRAEAADATSYESIKKFLFQELHLSPSVYLDKFNALVRDKDEIFGQFSTRLTSLFEYYVESRKVDHSYDKLVDLMIYYKTYVLLLELFYPTTNPYERLQVTKHAVLTTD